MCMELIIIIILLQGGPWILNIFLFFHYTFHEKINKKMLSQKEDEKEDGL